jgi:hypothetical protein
MVPARLRVPGWPAHDLCPVGSEALDVLGVLAGMRERVVQLRVLETPRVVCSGEGASGPLPVRTGPQPSELSAPSSGVGHAIPSRDRCMPVEASRLVPGGAISPMWLTVAHEITRMPGDLT